MSLTATPAAKPAPARTVTITNAITLTTMITVSSANPVIIAIAVSRA